MKALQVTARGQAEFVDAPEPELRPGHVLVRPRHLALCGSDIWFMDYAPEDRFPCKVGTTGHEVIAEVVQVADDCKGAFRPGELTLTLVPDHGGMAELYLAPVENVLPLPTKKTPEEYLMAQQLGTVIYACIFAPSFTGKTVAVIGQGSAGIWFNVMCKRLGASRVIALDHHEHRLAVSKFYGADFAINGAAHDVLQQFADCNEGEEADIVIEAAGRESSINLSYDLAKDFEGFILQFGLPRMPMQVDYGKMFWKRLNVKSMVHAAREPHHSSTRYALDLIDEELDVSRVITHRVDFEDVHRAFDLQRTASDGAIKTLVDMP
ncbi:MAG: zinc-binding dehydrogenase [Planctomycetota bacterium]